ncbi:uncharacterized protein PHALS_15438 [Plasmopara halstedii]|uniref:Uncharacterized protein n=1 Tax=Plasmopara halstedii TaxID=4781 RepID=A0A0P1AHE2_PLAHL|nr:uncharacterized protein PHALS_15438 [Plasmopara halstedii]CEG40334.1 hypothetical protein PHALS_15438 [Plasmopara halstedii]|eukprot:XP_024576703.1 hypothetical protein PHALS_15438 [Plasmopara halstedii]
MARLSCLLAFYQLIKQNYSFFSRCKIVIVRDQTLYMGGTYVILRDMILYMGELEITTTITRRWVRVPTSTSTAHHVNSKVK